MYHSPHGWWIPDMELQCFVGKHRIAALAFGIIGVPLIIVGVPLFIFQILFVRRKRLESVDVQHGFLWLYHPFRP